MPQSCDIADEEMMAVLPSDNLDSYLKWFNGASNIPSSICGILLYLVCIAISLFGISNVFDNIVSRARRLPAYFDNLNKEYLKSRFRGHGLLNNMIFGNAEFGSNVSGDAVESRTTRMYNAYCTKLNLRDKYKFWTLVITWLLMAVQIEGGTVHKRDTAVGLEGVLYTTFPLARSQWCNIPETDVQCPTSDYTYKLKTETCEYECSSWEQIICMNSEYGMVFFCIPKGKTCSQGIGWNVEHVDNTDVVVKESFCREGYYQEEPPKCHNACATRHLSLDVLPIQFKVHSKGDQRHPANLMCDYTAGYYNADNKSYIRYDRNFAYYYQDFCTHVNISNPCSDGKIPLYNGTCVDKCSPGYERNKTDFKCKVLKEELDEKDENHKHSPPDTPAGQDKETISKGNTGNSIHAKSTEGLEKSSFPRKGKISVVHITIVCSAVIIVIALSTVVYRSGNFPEAQHYDKIVHEDGSSSTADILRTKTKPSGEEFKKKDDNTLNQTTLEHLNAQMQYVGALMIHGDIGGTVFRVGTRYVMTAFHVIRPVVYNDVSKMIELQRLRSEHIFVNFNAAIGIVPRIVCDLNCCFFNEELDIAVLELSNVSGLPEKMLLYKGDTTLRIETVSVIGFGNPKQQLKKHLDPLCRVVSPHGSEIRSACRYLRKKKKHIKKFVMSEIIDDGYKGYDDKRNIIFHGFLEHGASGGPLLVSNDPGSVQVVGVLTRGIPECFYKLPVNEQIRYPENHRFHLARRMRVIYEAIKSENEQLAKDLFGL